MGTGHSITGMTVAGHCARQTRDAAGGIADDRSRRHPHAIEQRARYHVGAPLLGMTATFTAVRGAGFTGGHASAGRVTNLSE